MMSPLWPPLLPISPPLPPLDPSPPQPPQPPFSPPPVTLGVRAEPRSSATAEPTHEHVDSVVFMASYAVGCVDEAGGSSLSACRVDHLDVQLLDHYARQLGRWQPASRMWMLLLVPELQRTRRVSLPGTAPGGLSHADGVLAWGERALWRRFPKMASHIETHPGLKNQTIAYLKLYYFFHASLVLWLDSLADAYPNVQHFWRMEPDVAFAGRFDLLLTLAAHETADVLLPTVAYRQSMLWEYNHWEHNREWLSTVPLSKHAYALVCIGRYSRRFLRELLLPRWESGLLGYEEIVMPTLCLNTSSVCSFARMSTWHSVSARHVHFKPKWRCSDFLAAMENGTLSLWHPLKDRDCLLDWLDAGGAERVSERFEQDAQWSRPHALTPARHSMALRHRLGHNFESYPPWSPFWAAMAQRIAARQSTAVTRSS